MTPTTTTTPTQHQVVVKHPIRGAIWGLLLGLGVAIYLVLFRVVPFGDWIPLGLVVVGGIAVGVLWAYVAPPKRPRDDAGPVAARRIEAPAEPPPTGPPPSEPPPDPTPSAEPQGAEPPPDPTPPDGTQGAEPPPDPTPPAEPQGAEPPPDPTPSAEPQGAEPPPDPTPSAEPQGAGGDRAVGEGDTADPDDR